MTVVQSSRDDLYYGEKWRDLYFDCQMLDYPDGPMIRNMKIVHQKAEECMRSNEELLALMNTPEYINNPSVLLSRMAENNEILCEDDKMWDLLIKSFFPFVVECAYKHNVRGVSLEKMVRAGFIALQKQVNKRDLSSDEDYIDIVEYCIEEAVLNVKYEDDVWG